MEFQALKDLEILFGLALVTVVLFRKLLMPSIIGFLATGILAGPHVFGLISSTHDVEQMAELGVVLLLFTIGIEFSLTQLRRVRLLVFWGGGAQIVLTILAVSAAGALFNLPWNQAIFLGFLVALSSTAILMKLLMDSGEMDSPQGKTALGILIFQDLCVVPLMLLVPFLAGKGGGWSDILLLLARAGGVVVFAHYGARYAIPWILGQVVKTRSRELFILTIIVVGFGTAWLTSLAGLSLALGAFIAGLAISESEYSHQALGDIIPFRDAFMSLFFISVGMLLDLNVCFQRPLVIIALVAAIILVKSVIAAGSVLLLGIPARIAIVTGLALSQVGEFSFVLSLAGVKAGLLPNDLYQLFLAASVATMALTPLCLRYGPSLAEALCRVLPRPLVRGRNALVQGEQKIRQADHVIIIGYGLNGKNLAKVLKAHGIAYAVVEANPFTISAERKRGSYIVFGDATRAEVLEHVQIAKARILVIAISDAAASRQIAALARQINPALHIIVRTRYLAEMAPLYGLGANEVIPEEFETSVEIFSRVLKRFLIPHDRIEECIASVRKDSYDMFRSLSRRNSHATGITGFLAGAEVGSFTVGKGSVLDGESLRGGTLRSRSGAMLLAIRRGEEVVANPDPVWELQENDVALLVGTPEQLAVAARLFETHQPEPESAA
jgi:monovalent cation:H+ antiporter-2, CPA2 family